MQMKLKPAVLSGKVRAITSKSMAHRSLICAALSDGSTELIISDRSADIEATMDCLRAMGAEIEIEGELCRVTSIMENKKTTGEENSESENRIDADCADLDCMSSGCTVLNCRESGSTLRFLLPVAAVLCEKALLLGEGRLPQRPLDPLIRVMKEKGTRFTWQENGETLPQPTEGKTLPQPVEGETLPQPTGRDTLPLTVEGRPRGGTYKIEGNISSQYISGLLFALPMLEEDSEIRLTSPMESSAYVDMTIEALERFGIQVEKQYRQSGGMELAGFTIPGGQTYRCPKRIDVEGDWSNAAFFLAAGALSGAGIECSGLNLKSIQGDRSVAGLLKSMGAAVSLGETVSVSPAGLKGLEIDVSQIPDLMPVMAVTACGAKGTTIFRNAGRLRLKESDRIASTAELIRSLGGDAEEGEDGLIVRGTGSLRGGVADSFGDHRIAMSAAVAAIICREPVILNGAEAVGKSYPQFFRDYNALGGNAHVI